jgi:two-component system NtrC family sensor kinase
VPVASRVADRRDERAAWKGRPSHIVERPSLRTELLLNVAVLATGALVLAMGSALLVPMLGEGRLAVLFLASLVLADLAIFILFGRYLVNRLVLRPLDELVAATDAVASGHLERRAPPAATRELDQLAVSVNRMTERLLDAQGALVQAEKLASVGRLAAGIAHEIGNPLAAIANFVEVLKRRGVEPEVVEALEREAGRIDAIIESLLAYARPKEPRREVVQPGEIVKGAAALLESQGLTRSVALTIDLDRATPPVLGDRTSLEQIVVNLLLNALDAVDEAGGRISVSVRPARSGEEAPRRTGDPGGAAQPRSSRRGGYLPGQPDGTRAARIVVTDNGPGVSHDIASRVFDPFFTTREPGKGTGLGLAIVQRLVEDHGGRVELDRAREGGAAFIVTLPGAPDEAAGN